MICNELIINEKFDINFIELNFEKTAEMTIFKII